MRRTIGTMVAATAIAGAAMIATGASAQEATPTPSLTVPEELLEPPANAPDAVTSGGEVAKADRPARGAGFGDGSIEPANEPAPTA